MLRRCFKHEQSKNGMAAQITSTEKRAVYMHCYAHALNLAVSYTVKQSKVCCEALEVVYEINKLIKFSLKRNASFNAIKAQIADEDGFKGGIRTFCPTQWTVQGNAVGSILENYIALCQLWEECLEGKLHPDIRGRIIGVKSQRLKFTLWFGLRLCERILKISDNLSMTLQKQSLSAAQGYKIAQLTIKRLQRIRTSESFKNFFETLKVLCSQFNVEAPVLPRKRRAPKRIKIGEGECYYVDDVEDYYRVQYFEAIDLAITGITNRFDQPGYTIYSNLESILVKAANQDDYSTELEQIVSFYENLDKSLLQTQLQIFSSKYVDATSKVSLKEIFDYLRTLTEDQCAFFSEVNHLAKLILVMPASNAASERSFLTMRKIKNYLRSTMGQVRFNDLMILNIYKEEELDALDLTDIAKEFVQNKQDHRYKIFGDF